MTWSDTTMSLSGNMAINCREMEMVIESETSGSSSWALIKEKQEDE